jgi:hypothetical protein
MINFMAIWPSDLGSADTRPENVKVTLDFKNPTEEEIKAANQTLRRNSIQPGETE